jgi:hypothetical protein
LLKENCKWRIDERKLICGNFIKENSKTKNNAKFRDKNASKILCENFEIKTTGEKTMQFRDKIASKNLEIKPHVKI